MRRYRYLADPLFLGGCLLYALNRWVLKPHIDNAFLHSYFNDLLLIPCAIPPLLLLHRLLGLRNTDTPPTLLEVAGHLVLWSILFEVYGPRWMPHTTADLSDIAAYTIGGIAAYLWWHRHNTKPA